MSARRAAAIGPARAAAFEVLQRVFEQDAYADRALRSASVGLDDRDRALARQLSYGAVQRARTLDHAIETIGRRPVRKLDPPVRAALRLGAFQLGYLDGVPRYAAVNESVELVRRAKLERAVPFANAVLRRLADGIGPLLDGLGESTAREAALRHSYPDWVAETWWEELGPADAIACMRAQNEPSETVVRLVRGDIEGEETDVPGAWRVDRVDETALHEGRIWPQSRGSQLAGLAVASQPGERILDVCAAPGGKATMLAGDVVAVEVNEARAGELVENARLLGATNVDGRPRRRSFAPGRPDRVRPGTRGRALLGARCPGLPSRPPVALSTVARAPAGAAASGGGACPSGWDGRLLRLHDPP